MVRVRCVAHDSDQAQVLGLVYCNAGERQVFIYAQPDGASRRRDWMAPRARDGELYCSDGLVAGACVVLVHYGALDLDKAQVLGWLMETPMTARSLYTRRPMAPVGVKIG